MCYKITCIRFSCYVELDILLVIVKLASNGSNKIWFWTKWSSAFSFSNHDNFLGFPQVPHNLCRNSPLFVSCEKFALYSYDHNLIIQKAGSNRNWAMGSVDGFSPWKEENQIHTISLTILYGGIWKVSWNFVVRKHSHPLLTLY